MDDAKVIGYFAFSRSGNVFCDGDACLVIGSEADIRRYLSERGSSAAMSVKKTRYWEIMAGIRAGAAYSFDEVAYNRFYPLAARDGLSVGPENFGPTPTGRHFVRLQVRNNS